MFKKSDILPAILALGSTLGVMLIGYGIFVKLNPESTAKQEPSTKENDLTIARNDSSNLATPAVSFSAPGIVPMGTSIKINGATKMEQINKSVKKSFQKEFPGTTVNVDADGSSTGMRLLLSGQVDLAAIARPLSDNEKAKGLTAVNVFGEYVNDSDLETPDTLFYAYREPANSKVEAFLGHLFSAQGQEAILNR